jgi:hypothetical protein
MRLKEQKLWDRFKAHAGKELDLERVENLVGDGMPDVYSVGTGVWVELKAPIVPKRANTPLLGEKEGLRVSQKNWIRNAVNRGRAVFILIRDSESELYLVPGQYCSVINAMSRESIREASVARDWLGIIWEIKNVKTR